jgi:hypothetical protein
MFVFVLCLLLREPFVRVFIFLSAIFALYLLYFCMFPGCCRPGSWCLIMGTAGPVCGLGILIVLHLPGASMVEDLVWLGLLGGWLLGLSGSVCPRGCGGNLCLGLIFPVLVWGGVRAIVVRRCGWGVLAVGLLAR